MSPNFECLTCHALQQEPDELCVPVPIRNECLKPTDLQTNTARACNQVVEHAAFHCEGCGRPTPEPQIVCMPMLTRPYVPEAESP